MGQKRKKMPGLVKRGEVWHINKVVDGQRLCESTGTSELAEAERYLVRRLETYRQAKVYGLRPKRTFDDAASRFVDENPHKRSLSVEVTHLKKLMPYIGHLALESIHMGSLQPFVEARRKEGRKARTINYGLQVTRRILNLAADEWMDEHGLTWLHMAPKIKLLPLDDARKPNPLDWDEQERLFACLPAHLRDMALFAVNVGCRDREICCLRWEWEIPVSAPEIGSVFIVPASKVKNKEDRLVVLNKTARAVIERQRGKNPEWVFTYRGSPINRMLNRGWRKAREQSGVIARVHDLKHTFGRRLRAVGVSFEDRQDLLGHKSARITTHYSSAELLNLWQAANKVCDAETRGTVSLLKTVMFPSRAKVAQTHLGGQCCVA